jgi:hypothetical protein
MHVSRRFLCDETLTRRAVGLLIPKITYPEMHSAIRSQSFVNLPVEIAGMTEIATYGYGCAVR